MKNKTLFFTILIATSSFIATAQNNSYTVNAAGGSAVISGNIYEWSIGEMVLVNTATTSNLIVTQGLLQNTNQGVGIKDAALSTIQLLVYPNPTKDFLLVQTKLPANTQLDIAVYDLMGRVIQRKEYHIKSANEVQRIDFRSFSAGMYMLEINTELNGETYKNSFKIQNNK